MQKIKITAVIDMANPVQMQAAADFFSALSDSSEVTQTETPTQPKQAKPKRKRRTKAEIDAEKAQKENADAVDTSEKETDNTSGPTVYKISDVRTKLSEKVANHRTAIKGKLSDLGAKNVSSMKPEDYTEFVEFLDSLD